MNSGFIKNKSELFKESLSTLQRLISEEGSKTATKVYAHAIHEVSKKLWTNKFDLKESNGVPCIQRLLGKQCGQKLSKLDCVGHAPPAVDHSSLWLKEGKPFFYVYQPYSLDSSTVSSLVDFCKQYDLEFQISTWPSWHFPGSVLSVIIRKSSNDPFHFNNL